MERSKIFEQPFAEKETRSEKREQEPKRFEQAAVAMLFAIQHEKRTFEEKLAEADTLGASLGIEGSRVQEISRELGVEEKLNQLRKDEHTLFAETVGNISEQLVQEDFKKLDLTRREFLVESGKMAAKAGALAVLENILAPKKAFGFLDKLLDKRKEKTPKEIHEAKVREVRAQLMTDKQERMFFFFKNKDGGEWNDLGQGGETSAYMPFDGIKEKLKEHNYEQVILIHTHPVHGYQMVGLDPLDSFDDTEVIRTRKKDYPPMPPSPNMDILGAIQAMRFFDKDYKKITQEVIDPSGVWEYKISDPHNSFIKNMGDYLEQMENLNEEDYLNKDQIALLEKFRKENAELIKNTDPRNLILVLKFHPDSNIQKIGDDIEKEIIKHGEAVLEEATFIYEMGMLGREIAKSPYSKKKDQFKKRGLIQKYINAWKEKGIEINYQFF